MMKIDPEEELRIRTGQPARCDRLAFHSQALATDLWTELIEGRFRVLESTHSDTRSVLALAWNPNQVTYRERERRKAALLRRMLIGEGQKSLAYGGSVSISTIAAACGDSLCRMGLRRRLLSVPYLLVRAAHVASGIVLPPCDVMRDGASYYVSIPRPELALRSVLSVSECMVAGLIVEGLTNDAIARLRGVSTRTIANQVASAFRKTNTSGRVQLLCTLVRLEADQQGTESLASDCRQLFGTVAATTKLTGEMLD